MPDTLRLAYLLIAVLSLLVSGQRVFASPTELSPKVHDLIERFFAAPEFNDLQLSPDGSHVAFLKEIRGQMALGTIELKTLKPAVTAPGFQQDIVNFNWVGPDQLIFEILQKPIERTRPREADRAPDNPDELRYIYLGHWLADATLSRMGEIPSLGPIYVMVDPLPQDPTGVLLAQQSGDNFFGPLYRYDPTRNKVTLIEPNPGRVIGWFTDISGHVRLAAVAEKAGRYSYIFRETEKSPWQPLPLPNNSDFITFDPSGRNLLVSYPDATGRFVMQSYDLVAHRLTDQPVTDPIYDVNPSVVRDPRTGAARGLECENDKSKFIWLDPSYRQLQAQLSPALPGAIVNPIGVTQTGDIFVVAYSDVSPTKFYLLNPKTGRLALFLDERPKVSGLPLSPMKPFTFKATDGTDLHGYLTLPPDRATGKPLPLIALVHGGPMVRDSWGYDSEVQYFSSLGYAVLQLNYRGSTGYGKPYALNNIIEVGQHSVDDVADSLRWAVDQGVADPKRLIVCGGSYGGYVALGVATRYPALPACVVGFAGVYDWEFETRSDREKFHEIYQWQTDYFPDIKKNAARYQAISPVHLATAVTAPVLLVHGRKDQRVDIAQSELMARALRQAGKNVEIVKDAEGIHGLPDEKLRRAYYERVTAFILKYAPPDKLP